MEWNTATEPDDPVLVVPWHSPDGKLRWIDLRSDPDALDEIAEADEFPPLLAALRSLNAGRSPVFSAKCDVWQMDEDEITAVRQTLLVEKEIATAGFACYIDLLWRDRSTFVSRHRTEQALYRLDRLAAELPHSLALIECTVRPAVLDLEVVSEGYAVTMYVKGVGVDEEEARERWAEALRDTAMLFRSKELATF